MENAVAQQKSTPKKYAAAKTFKRSQETKITHVFAVTKQKEGGLAVWANRFLAVVFQCLIALVVVCV